MSVIEINEGPLTGDFDDEMEEFARDLIRATRKQGVKLEEKIKVFETVASYHATREKYKGKAPEGGKPKPRRTFAEFREAAQQE